MKKIKTKSKCSADNSREPNDDGDWHMMMDYAEKMREARSGISRDLSFRGPPRWIAKLEPDR